MTKIAIFNDWISNTIAGGVYRVLGLANAFIRLGFEVYIVTPWGITQYQPNKVYNQPKGKSPLYYITTGFMLPLQTLRLLNKEIDLAIIEMPSPITKALSIMPLLKLLKIPIILDFADPWWKIDDNYWYKKVAEKIVKIQAKSSILVTSSSKLILEYFRGIAKYLHIPNGVDEELFKPKHKYIEYLIGFLGTFNERNGSKIIIPMLQSLSKEKNIKDIKFILVGGGEDLDYIIREARKIGLSNKLIALGSLPRDKIPGYLSMAQILVAPYKESFELHFIFPTKVPEMLALRRPVITARLFEIITTFRVDHELLVSKYDPKSYANNIKYLIQNKDLANKLAENGYKKVISELTWEKLALKLLTHIESDK